MPSVVMHRAPRALPMRNSLAAGCKRMGVLLRYRTMRAPTAPDDVRGGGRRPGPRRQAVPWGDAGCRRRRDRSGSLAA